MEFHRTILEGKITFADSKSVFYSGQLLRGNISFKLNSPLHISAIDIVYLGEANVEWNEEQQETYGGYKRLRNLKHVGKEQYFNDTQRITQGPSTLHAGVHSIPFFYQVPFNAPSSFKSEKGQVTYTITAIITHQDGVTKNKISGEFNVIAPLNLNTASDDVKSPLVIDFADESVSCRCFCSSKSLSVKVRLPSQGFCPGQTIPITVDVRNQTSVEITKILFQIHSRERFRSHQPISEYEPPLEVLASTTTGPILSNTSGEFMFQLKVPDFIAPNLEYCSVIDVGYFFRVKVKLSGCNDDLEDEAEICIGLVPLGENVDVRNTHPMAEELPNAPLPDRNAPPAILPPAYQPTFTPKENNVQICPTGPIPYPTVANVVDKPIFGSKNSPMGAFEIGFRLPDSGVNSTLPNPVPPYPFPNSPQNQSQNYPSQPSAPPPY